MKYFLVFLMALFAGAAQADTYNCADGVIAITGDRAIFVDWGRPGANCTKKVISRSGGQIVIDWTGDGMFRVVLSPLGGGQYRYLSEVRGTVVNTEDCTRLH